MSSQQHKSVTSSKSWKDPVFFEKLDYGCLPGPTSFADWLEHRHRGTQMSVWANVADPTFLETGSHKAIMTLKMVRLQEPLHYNRRPGLMAEKSVVLQVIFWTACHLVFCAAVSFSTQLKRLATFTESVPETFSLATWQKLSRKLSKPFQLSVIQLD